MAELKWTNEALDWLEVIHRYVAQDNHRVAYLHRNDSETIEVIGVFHGALNIDRYLP